MLTKISQFNWAIFERPVSRLCSRYVRIVTQYPTPFIIIPIVLTATLSTGLLQLNVYRNVDYLFSPSGARWKYEEQVFRENFARSDDQYYPGKDVLRRTGLHLIVASLDGGSVLRKDEAEQFVTFLDWISNSTFTYNKTEYHYSDVCHIFRHQCFNNIHAYFLAKIFINGEQTNLNVTYPQFHNEIFSTPIDLTMTLGGVKTDPLNGIVSSAKAWFISYSLKQENEHLQELSKTWENVMGQRIRKKEIPTTLLNIFFFHADTLEEELVEGNRRTMPKFIVTFFVLIGFSIFGTMTLTRNGRQVAIDWVVSKPYLACVGILSTLFAIVSAIGLGLHLGILFIDMVTVMPFLVISIGIDDMFLIVAAWRSTNRNASVADRLERAMQHAGVSVTMTSATDALSFFIGSMAPLPAVTQFCLYAATAICFNYLYTMTIFLAIVALQGSWEKQNRHCCTGQLANSDAEISECSQCIRFFNIGSRPLKSIPFVSLSHLRITQISDIDIPESSSWYQRFFEDYYAPMLTKPITKIFVAVLFVGYLFVSISGICHLNIGFNWKDIVLEDSPARGFLEQSAKYFPVDLRVDIAVSNPPNMGNPAQREAFMSALEALENTSCSAGRNSTDFWFFGFKKYIEKLGFGSSWRSMLNKEEVFNLHLGHFLTSDDNYGHDVLFGPEKEIGGEGNITVFRLSTKLSDTSTNNKIMACADDMRAAADAFPQFNITTYTPMWNLADQFEIILPQTLQNLAIDLACMFVISLLFIPQPLCAIAVVLSILSVHTGVLGLMTWWGVNLDAASMITLAVSVGFSVDFAAHITYAYISAGSSTHSQAKIIMPDRRVALALGDLGWPLVQGATATLLGVGVLGTVDSFVIQTVFKTIMLVISLGLLHALVFLPLAMSSVHSVLLVCNRLKSAKIVPLEQNRR